MEAKLLTNVLFKFSSNVFCYEFLYTEILKFVCVYMLGKHIFSVTPYLHPFVKALNIALLYNINAKPVSWLSHIKITNWKINPKKSAWSAKFSCMDKNTTRCEIAVLFWVSKQVCNQWMIHMYFQCSAAIRCKGGFYWTAA